MKTGTLLDYAGVPNALTNGEQPTFRRGEPAQHERGVSYRAPWEREGDGFSEHSRRSAAALAAAGVPTHLRGFSSTQDASYQPELIRPLLNTSIRRYSVEVFQVVVQGSILQNITNHAQASMFRVHLSREELNALNSFRVLYSVWERDRISPSLVEQLNKFGQVWTGCELNKQMLIQCGVDAEKLAVVPIPHFANDPLLEVAEAKLKGPRKPGPVRFYNIGKWEPRKAQDRLVHCFLLAFKPGEAHLFLKTSRLKTKLKPHRGVVFPQWILEGVEASLAHPHIQANGWTKDNWTKAIQFTDEFLRQETIVKVHSYGDVYVTLSRGEGFDMPAYDAKIAGNMLVYTPSGGPQDFASPDDWLVPQTGSQSCHPFYNWEPNAEYLDFSDEDVVDALRKAHASIRLGRTGHHNLRNFRAEHVGINMRKQLEALTSKHQGKLV